MVIDRKVDNVGRKIPGPDQLPLKRLPAGVRSAVIDESGMARCIVG